MSMVLIEKSVCFVACLPTHLPCAVCLVPALCLPACLVPACLPACLPACPVPACLPALCLAHLPCALPTCPRAPCLSVCPPGLQGACRGGGGDGHRAHVPTAAQHGARIPQQCHRGGLYSAALLLQLAAPCCPLLHPCCTLLQPPPPSSAALCTLVHPRVHSAPICTHLHLPGPSAPLWPLCTLQVERIERQKGAGLQFEDVRSLVEGRRGA